ncbi:myosin heavy chain, striated muscle isoform X2 [Drosophila serrata]|uniref:myosin heavy chain, striated muscle isoform X2 n=1 Tax=Drosophila serrata TaxID=7274 RepID=UPI000A1D03B8|nr:myosin heavy chain, striated muscle isoform X2 [Drosophila serrata]
MKSSKGGISKKSKTMDYTNYAYNEAVGRLKVMLADNSYVAPKLGGGASSYLRSFNEDSGDNFSDNLSVIERPVFSDISKYLSPSQKTRMTSYRPKKSYTSGYLSASKENLASPSVHYPSSSIPAAPLPADNVSAPVEIFSFIEKQEDYIEQLEKESKYCRSELTNLLGKVKDVINENEQLTENARSELVALGSGKTQQPLATTSPSSDSDEHRVYASGRKTPTTPRKGASKGQVQSPRYASAPNIVYEARISELEAELMQASIDLRRLRTENEELKRKLSHTDPLSAVATLGSAGGANCELHRKQLETLQQDKLNLEESVRQLQRLLDEAKAHSQGSASSKRYINDLVQMERSQAELEVRHLRDELDRQHERVRELQHEMARRLAEERASAERRYNSQVDQLGGDLSCQWEQVAKLQLDLERQKRYETDLKREVASRNSQIEELKMELRANRTTFLADMAQVNAEKQSLEQDITSLRLQLDRAARETKTEAARLTAEINSLRQRLDRGDADLLHSKREVLRLNDEIANLEKELAYGELKNEIRPTKKDLDKRISEMQEKHAGTVNELEEMITSQKQLMDKLTSECKTLTGKLEDTTYKHNQEKQQLRATNEQLMSRLRQIWAKYKSQLPVHQGTPEPSSEERHPQDTPMPLTTTRQRHMAPQSNPYKAPHNHTTAPTTTTRLDQDLEQEQEQDQASEQDPEQEQLLAAEPVLQQQQLQQDARAALATARVCSPTMDSTITMTRISRTTLAWAKSSNSKSSRSRSRNGNGSGRSETGSCSNYVSSGRSAKGNGSGNGNEPSSPTSSRRSSSRHQDWPRAALPMPVAPTWPPTTPTTVPTTSSSTRPEPTIPMPMPSTNTRGSSTTMVMPVEPTTMEQPTMDSLDTSMTPRQQPPLPFSLSPSRSSTRRQLLPSEWPRITTDRHRRWQRRQRASRPRQAQPLDQQEEQQEQEQEPGQEQQLQQHRHHHLPERADHNRARAVELWGQQLLLEQSPAENPLCHNSLPRQPPARSSWSPVSEDLLPLECSISSPSLMRSSNDETCSELADLSETYLILPDEGSEESLSPAHTTIITARRSSAPAVVQQEEAVNETVIIERHLDAHG